MSQIDRLLDFGTVVLYISSPPSASRWTSRYRDLNDVGAAYYIDQPHAGDELDASLQRAHSPTAAALISITLLGHKRTKTAPPPPLSRR